MGGASGNRNPRAGKVSILQGQTRPDNNNIWPQAAETPLERYSREQQPGAIGQNGAITPSYGRGTGGGCRPGRPLPPQRQFVAGDRRYCPRAPRVARVVACHDVSEPGDPVLALAVP